MKKNLVKKLTAVCMAALMLAGCGGASVGTGSQENPGSTEEKDVSQSNAGTSDNESKEEVASDNESKEEVVSDNGAAEAPSDDGPVGGAVEVTEKKESKVVFYDRDAANVGEKTVYFFNGNESVAYMEAGELFDLLSDMLKDQNPDYNYSYGYEGKTFSVERENGTAVLINFESGTMDFDDLYMFTCVPDATSWADVVQDDVWQRNEDGSIKTDKDGARLVNLLSRVSTENNFSREGYSLTLDLSQYHIPVYFDGGKGYLPVATFNDLFVTEGGQGFLNYNEGRLFLMEEGLDEEVKNADGKTMKDIWYEIAPKERTKELSEFNYWELVLFLNGNYGLKKEHNINTDFDEYLEVIGLKERLLSTDPITYSDALAELVYGHFGDLHSSIVGSSPYLGPDARYEETVIDGSPVITNVTNPSSSFLRFVKTYVDYNIERNATDCVDEDGSPIPYMEIGNTAYVTFDQFIEKNELDLYDPDAQAHLEDSIGEDTRALVVYANREITREGSPVENVVIDLSCNTGGQLDTAVYISSWLMGTCNFSAINPKTMAQSTIGYKADVDLDGKITEDDALDLNRYRVYCLEGPVSFSCGNLVPSLLKESGKVTLLGRTSGGGACAVRPTVGADGTFFNISGIITLSTNKNGSYYVIDQGADPDVSITNPANFYDRLKLTEFINGLM